MYQWRSSPENGAPLPTPQGNIPDPNTPTIWSVKRGRPIAKQYSGLTAPVAQMLRG
jgi:hypothetical protein